MTNEELIRQLKTASVQADDMRLRDFGYLFKTAAEAIERLVAYNEFWEHSAHKAKKMLEENLPKWIPHTMDGGTISSIQHDYDGKWVIVTDGNSISVERIKKDAFDHFYPAGRLFALEDVTYWMPLPEPPKEVNT